MRNEDMLIAIYGLQQTALKREKLIDGNAVPIKQKIRKQDDRDALDLYKWLAEQLINFSEQTINDRKQIFNSIVNKLEKEYLLNMYLMSIFMLEEYLDLYGNKAQKIIVSPKINRLNEFFRAQIMLAEGEEKGLSIVRDSKIGSSNVIRGFLGQPELTKAMRKYKADLWRRAAKQKEEMG